MARKTTEEIVADLQAKVKKHQDNIDSLNAKIQKTLASKDKTSKKAEIEKLYELMQKSGKTASEIEALLTPAE